MKEADECARRPIDRRDITSLISVADGAGIREVRHFRGPSVLTADYVVDLAAEERVVFMDPAILATATGMYGDDSSQVRGNFTRHE